jgi:trigger factor
MHVFQLGQYKGLEITPQAMFTETELDTAVIQTMLKMFEQWAKNNHTAEKGDEVAVSVDAEYDGLPFPELCSSYLRYTVGDSQMLAEFNNVLGKKKGDCFRMKITFPQNVPSQRAAGKTINFTATVLEIWPAKQAPITDAIARKLDPQVSGIDNLRAKVRRSIISQSRQIIRENNLQAILEAIIAKATYELDPAELAKATRDIMTEALHSPAVLENGKDIRQILSGNDPDPYFYEDCSDLAKQQILTDLALKELARLENLSLTEQEVANEKAKTLEQMQGNVQIFQDTFPSMEVFRKKLLEEKLADCLLEWNLKNTN